MLFQILFLLLAILATQGQDNLECPVIEKGTVGICIQGCSSDRQCKSGEKCCSNGCGQVCQKACLKVACKCPYGTNFSIENGCQKCSCNPYNPCAATTCPINTECKLDPQTNKALCLTVNDGVCPKPRDGLITPCIVKCQSDENCASNEKCCSWGCSRVCKKSCQNTALFCKCAYGRNITNDLNGCEVCSCIDPCAVRRIQS